MPAFATPFKISEDSCNGYYYGNDNGIAGGFTYMKMKMGF